ncbi:hypothetical protein BC830DRAFT_1124057 [Chytriomyces sp. MP71]|nr:hypothetical protein BC830DRAFT_1124057 [Chytriomyces sp. MP71]
MMSWQSRAKYNPALSGKWPSSSITTTLDVVEAAVADMEGVDSLQPGVGAATMLEDLLAEGLVVLLDGLEGGGLLLEHSQSQVLAPPLPTTGDAPATTSSPAPLSRNHLPQPLPSTPRIFVKERTGGT